MTEAEWLTSESPERMLRFIWETASDRKLRLFAVACARRLDRLSGGEFAQHLVGKFGPAAEFGHRLSTAERFADGKGSGEELKAAWDAGLNIRVLGAAPLSWRAVDYAEAAAGDTCDSDATDAALWSMLNGQSGIDLWAKEDAASELSEGTEYHPQAHLLRDIFGDPSRPVEFSPAWWTETVVALARGMYDSREFSAMPILADALEEAGCDNVEILTHCRRPGLHVRGCWVLDLIVGKT